MARARRAAAAEGKLDEAAAASIAADRAVAQDPRAPAANAPYLRSRTTAALCARARAQSVSCAKLEKARFGDRTYYDFSGERAGAFDPARADAVLAEYESTLQDCLAAGAKKNLTTNSHVELVWSVANDGHVKPEFDLAPSRLRGTVVDTCLAAAFATFRYPPYRGEMQHVRLSFDVGE